MAKRSRTQKHVEVKGSEANQSETIYSNAHQESVKQSKTKQSRAKQSMIKTGNACLCVQAWSRGMNDELGLLSHVSSANMFTSERSRFGGCSQAVAALGIRHDPAKVSNTTCRELALW